MKKAIVGMLTAALTIALCVIMTACSTSFEGTWKLSKITMTTGGIEQTVEVGKEYNGTKISADAFILEVKDDNTYSIKGQMTEIIGGEESGTWKEEDGKYYLTAEEESIEVKLSGSTLLLEQEIDMGNGTTMKVSIEFKK